MSATLKPAAKRIKGMKRPQLCPPHRTILLSELTELQPCRAKLPAGKPMTFRAVLSDERIIIKRATEDGLWQLLADALKPLFGLNQIKVDRALGTFDFRLKPGERSWTSETFESFEAPDTLYLIFQEAQGATQLRQTKQWKSQPALMLQYLEIALFRYGTLRYKDMTASNVLKLSQPSTDKALLSIDEMTIGRTILLPETFAVHLRHHKHDLDKIITKWQQIPLSELQKACRKVGCGQQQAQQLADDIAAHLQRLPADLSAAIDQGKAS